MSSNVAALISSSKSYCQKLKFNPLYNEDGSPSYLRASLLAIFALSLILHVFLKSSSLDNNSQAVTNELNIVFGNTVEHKSFDSFNHSELNNSQHGTIEPNVSSLQSVKGDIDNNKEMLVSNNEGWSFLGFDSPEAKENKKLLANRKQAVTELIDGAAFLSSCGDINAGYLGCKFVFSKKVSANYDSNIESAADSFKITLVAKGTQQKDICAKFVVNSKGLYQAFDAQGYESQKCLMSSGISNQMLTFNSAVDNFSNNVAQSGSKLVANNK